MFRPNKVIKSIAFIVSVLATSFSLGYVVFAWTEPASVPPGGNDVSVPLNIGPTGQAKEGGLILGTNCVGPCTVGLIVDKGNVGIGTNAPEAKLDINSDTFILKNAKTPAASNSACTVGMHAWDADYIYICVAVNTWKRANLSTW